MPDTSNEINGILINTLFGILNKKITTPTDFHDQVDAVKTMLTNDVTGLIDSLSDFLVSSSNVNYQIQTESDKLDKTLKKWLSFNINKDYKGQVPRGINSLAEEYFKERWKSSSFPILKITKWDTIDGIKLPVKMFFVDGGSVYEKAQSSVMKIGKYKYFLGKGRAPEERLEKGVIITKPFGRWFDRYPVPFLIKRGIYANYRLIDALKTKQSEILNQIIPYMLLLKKGTEGLALAELKGEGGKIYSDPDLKKIVTDLKKTIKDSFNSLKAESLTRVSQFDEELKHLIPELDGMFKPLLFAAAEKAVLGGFGFLDIAQAISSNRTESILNPTAFINEVNRGVKDFKNQILWELIYRVMEENKEVHKIYMNKEFEILASPVKGFTTDKFRTMIRSFYDRGIISRQTAVEMGVEVPFESEVLRIKNEKKRNLEKEQYPPITQNLEQHPDAETQPKDKKDKQIPEDKTNPIEKKNFNNAKVIAKCFKCKKTFNYLDLPESRMGAVKCPKCGIDVTQESIISGINNAELEDLETSPYKKITELPDHIRKYGLKAQRDWLKIFNAAYYHRIGKTGNKKEAERYANAVANSKLTAKKK